MHWRLAVTGLLVVAVTLASLRDTSMSPRTVYAAGTLDQQQATGVNFTVSAAGGPLMQTFTAGLSGLLDQVDITVSNPIGTTGTALVEIREVSAGHPTTTVLGNGTFDAATVATVATSLSVPLTTPAPITAGTSYAIVLLTDGVSGGFPGIFWWSDQTGNPYAGGHAGTSGDGGATWGLLGTADMAFKTYVSPAPTATPTGTPTPTATATTTLTPTVTFTVTPTATSPAGATSTPTSIPGATSTATATQLPASTSTPTVTPTASPTVTATATTPAQTNSPGDDDTDTGGRNRTREQRQQEQQTNTGNRDDVYTEGGVLEVGRDAEGAFVVIGMRDGVMVVRLSCGDQCPTINPGDYIQVEGTKENESLFYADEVSVSR